MMSDFSPQTFSETQSEEEARRMHRKASSELQAQLDWCRGFGTVSDDDFPTLGLSEAVERLIAAQKLLLDLARSPNPAIRLVVAAHINSVVGAIWALAGDVDPTVKYELAKNANCPYSVLKALLSDGNQFIERRAEQTLMSLLEGEDV